MGLSYLQEQTLRSDLDAQRPVKCKRKTLPTLQLGSAAASLVVRVTAVLSLLGKMQEESVCSLGLSSLWDCIRL